jgi:hypothetical protein
MLGSRAHSFRRRLRISVRALAAIIALTGVWLGYIVHGARLQRRAVTELEKAGAVVHYNGDTRVAYDSREYRPIWGEKPWAPEWVIRLIGIDYFSHVNAVWFPGATDETVRPLSQLPQVCDLDLSGRPDRKRSRITNVGLMSLMGMTELTELTLSNTDVTDQGLLHIRRLTKLTTLRLNGTQITDAGINQLSQFARMNVLEIVETRITGSGVAELKRRFSKAFVSHSTASASDHDDRQYPDHDN